jgi:hypothetical protein
MAGWAGPREGRLWSGGDWASGRFWQVVAGKTAFFMYRCIDYGDYLSGVSNTTGWRKTLFFSAKSPRGRDRLGDRLGLHSAFWVAQTGPNWQETVPEGPTS